MWKRNIWLDNTDSPPLSVLFPTKQTITWIWYKKKAQNHFVYHRSSTRLFERHFREDNPTMFIEHPQCFLGKRKVCYPSAICRWYPNLPRERVRCFDESNRVGLTVKNYSCHDYIESSKTRVVYSYENSKKWKGTSLFSSIPLASRWVYVDHPDKHTKRQHVNLLLTVLCICRFMTSKQRWDPLLPRSRFSKHSWTRLKISCWLLLWGFRTNCNYGSQQPRTSFPYLAFPWLCTMGLIPLICHNSILVGHSLSLANPKFIFPLLFIPLILTLFIVLFTWFRCLAQFSSAFFHSSLLLREINRGWCQH